MATLLYELLEISLKFLSPVGLWTSTATRGWLRAAAAKRLEFENLAGLNRLFVLYGEFIAALAVDHGWCGFIGLRCVVRDLVEFDVVGLADWVGFS